jgi:hypothetical protein
VNLAKAGRPKIAWCDDSKLATSNLINFVRKLFGGAKRDRECDMSKWHDNLAEYYPVEGDVSGSQ